MEYIASTLNNLIHQTAFFNLTWKLCHDSGCMLFPLFSYPS